MIEELDLRIFKSILADKINALTFASRYDTSLFEPDAQRFAKLILDYIKHFRAPPTKRTLLDQHGSNTTLSALIEKTWSEIEDFEYDIKEYPYDLKQLKKRFQLQAVEEIRAKAADVDPDTVPDPTAYFNELSLAISRITSVELERTYTQKTVGDYIDEFSDSYILKQNNPEQQKRIQTKYSLIDELADGIGAGELIMVGGDSGAGKSMVLNNMSKQIWLQDNTIESSPSTDMSRGYNLMYFSLEMSYEDCFIRFLASLANVNQKELSRATLNKADYMKVEKAKEFIKKYQDSGYFFDIVDVPRNLTIEEVELRYTDALLRYQPDVVVIDYMGLMHSTTLAKEPDWLKMGGIAASLHEFGRTYAISMLSAAQLTDIKRNANSGKDDTDKAVGMHRWGRSSLIMHNVNLAIQINKRHNEHLLPDLELHIVKNRKGQLGSSNWIKNFANASLLDIPYTPNAPVGDISGQNIGDLIKAIQDSKKNKA